MSTATVSQTADRNTEQHESTESVPDVIQFEVDTSGVDTSGLQQEQESDEAEESEITKLMRDINFCLELTGSKIRTSVSNKTHCQVFRNEALNPESTTLDEIEDWLEQVKTEKEISDGEQCEPRYPEVPESLIQLIDEARRKFRAESRSQAIIRLQREMHGKLEALREAKAEHHDAAEEAKSAKKAMETAQKALNSLVVELDDALHNADWQPHLPFETSEDSEIVDDQNSEAASATSDEQKPEKDPAIEAHVSHLGLSPSIVGKLEESDIDTIKELEVIMSQDRLRKVPGIGPVAIDRISDAVIDWRNRNGYGSESDD